MRRDIDGFSLILQETAWCVNLSLEAWTHCTCWCDCKLGLIMLSLSNSHSRHGGWYSLHASSRNTSFIVIITVFLVGTPSFFIFLKHFFIQIGTINWRGTHQRPILQHLSRLPPQDGVLYRWSCFFDIEIHHFTRHLTICLDIRSIWAEKWLVSAFIFIRNVHTKFVIFFWNFKR